MERFTIFRSHFESLKRCTPEIRLEVLDAMLGLAFEGKEPEFKDSMAEAIWIAIRPVVQLSIKQAQNGSRPKPRIKQEDTKAEVSQNPDEIQTETKTEPNEEVGVEIETTSTLKVDYGRVKELWDSICGDVLGRILKMTESRKQKIKTRAIEFEKSGSDYLATFEHIFRLAAQCDFIIGNNNRNWKANFDWFIENDKNYVKVLEGRYNHTAQHPTEQSETKKRLMEEKERKRRAAEIERKKEERKNAISWDEFCNRNKDNCNIVLPSIN